ncbi:MAG: protein meaA [Deltaproteobacteria bacterium]|nr:protein meaA [Deltaproteobacteria bacterium]
MHDNPWLIRTYSGHTSAKESNRLYKKNLAKGQTGLSIAFDLPTQTGYDSDHTLARGEVGKVGVPIAHRGDMEALFDGIPLAKMNSSMTINATAIWLLALYASVAEKQGASLSKLQGTTQNDILKEYLSRGTSIFPPEHSLRLTTDLIAYTVRFMPQWNPINICPYHLQEAGATPVQEIAFSIANAIAVLDAVKNSGQVSSEDFPKVVGRISFFVNAGIRFVEELCKMKAFVRLWDQITFERYGVTDPKYRIFRYGVQVNSLGLTEAQPENNIARIIYEMLAVTLSKEARARAIQLPCWNEAIGLPRPWDQQWSLRIQQILACETDLLEYEDIFKGSSVIEEKTGELADSAKKELQKIEDLGGAVKAISIMKQSLVSSNAARVKSVESGAKVVVGVNRFTETESSPLLEQFDGGFLKIDPKAEAEQVRRLQLFRKKRNKREVQKSLEALLRAAEKKENLVPVSIEAARAGVTTGEWASTLRQLFGEYRAPTGLTGTGLSGQSMAESDSNSFKNLRSEVEKVSRKLKGRIRILVGKPGLDGHSNGAEQIALRARDAGMEVIYQGIRLTPDEIVSSARDEGVHVIGLSILSGSHLSLIPEIIKGLKKAGIGKVPVVVGGIIPESDKKRLLKAGVKRVYTPKDFELNQIMIDIVRLLG